MLGKIGTKIAIFVLKHASLSLEDRNVLTAQILDNLSTLPLRGIIETNKEGNLLINGRPLDIDTARVLHESAVGALNNKALRMIREQVAYNAIVIGLHKAVKLEDTIFAKAAIWWGQQELRFLQLLAGEGDQESTL